MLVENIASSYLFLWNSSKSLDKIQHIYFSNNHNYKNIEK